MIFLHSRFTYHLPRKREKESPVEELIPLQWLDVSRLYLLTLALVKVKLRENYHYGPEN